MKTRVSFISSLPPHKGISFYSVPLLDALALQPGLEVEAISFRRLYPRWLYPGGSPLETTAPHPSHVSPRAMLDCLNPTTWPKTAIDLRGDIIHAQWWSHVLAPVYLTVLAGARVRGKKVVLTIHNVSPHEPSQWKRLADRAVLALAHHYIVHAPENAETLARLIPSTRGRISVVPMGPQPGPMTGLTKAQARARLGLTQLDKVILVFGNIRLYKRLDVMLEAFSALRSRMPRARLFVVGQPWLGSKEVRSALQQAQRQPGVTLRAEYVPEADVETYFAAADLVANAYSSFESQSAAASKAVAYGKALLVSTSGGLKNFVRDQRAIVEPGDVEGLARAAEAILSNPRLRRKLEQDSRRTAESISWTSIAEQTAHLYARILSGDSMETGPAVREAKVA